jgi:hypothetical protein
LEEAGGIEQSEEKTEESRMTTKWEYDIQPLPTAGQPTTHTLKATLNRLGDDGWELFHIDQPNYYFKRKKE